MLLRTSARYSDSEAGDAIAVLPYATHHVTVCDGIHARMLRKAPRQTHVRRLEGADPSGFPEPLSEAITALLIAAAPGGTFTISNVERRNYAIVVGLEPVGACNDVVAQISSARSAFLTILGELLGRELERPWQPHITLGYLRRRPPSADLEELVRRLDTETQVRTTRIHLAGAGFYRFNDMISFRRTPWPARGSPSVSGAGGSKRLARFVSRWRA